MSQGTRTGTVSVPVGGVADSGACIPVSDASPCQRRAECMESEESALCSPTGSCPVCILYPFASQFAVVGSHMA